MAVLLLVIGAKLIGDATDASWELNSGKHGRDRGCHLQGS
jgi:hypothetical protein